MDKDLFADVEEYLEDIFIICIQEYCSPKYKLLKINQFILFYSWGVRNSCSMIFSTLVQRSVGNLKITFHEFFHKYQKLIPFLIEHLKKTSHYEISDGILQNSIYPILLLFSKFIPLPPLSTNPKNEEDSKIKFIKYKNELIFLIQSYTFHSNYMVILYHNE